MPKKMPKIFFALLTFKSGSVNSGCSISHSTVFGIQKKSEQQSGLFNKQPKPMRLYMELFFDVLSNHFAVKQVNNAVCVVGIVR